MFPRQGSSLTPCLDKLFVFGGIVEGDLYSSDIYELRLQLPSNANEPKVILDLIHGDGPEPRAYHCAVSIDRFIIIMGGKNSKQVFGLKDSWVFDTLKKGWIKSSLSSEMSTGTERWGMSACENDGDIFLFGGVGETGPQCYLERGQLSSLTARRTKAVQPLNRVAMSSCLLRRTAALIRSPLQAIVLIVEAAELLDASHIEIRMEELDNRFGPKSLQF